MIGKERIVSPRANRIFLVGEISILERIHFLLMRKKRPPNTIATPQSITKNHFILDCDLCKSLNKVFGIVINTNKRKESPACFKILNLRAFPTIFNPHYGSQHPKNKHIPDSNEDEHKEEWTYRPKIWTTVINTDLINMILHFLYK